MNNLTPEQTLKLADTLSNLLPYYGSAAMLYQAVTGQTLSGQELGTADRWLSGDSGCHSGRHGGLWQDQRVPGSKRNECRSR
ncbi:hypothetical protein ACTMU2_33615 [Cupriavidus basilensis]